ncbi:MAG: ABC transporter substrate-binding protein/permease, partial [Rhodocyclales bacterium]|nr:ABC transporter substrate-binding protein/permease [Rhodocyclales bacterium]
ETLIASLAANKIDAIIANLTVTQPREQQVAFSQPYNFETLAVLVRAKDLAMPVAAATVATPAASPGWLAPLVASLTSTFITEQRWRLVLDGLWITLTVSLLATVFGTVLGAAICALRMAPQPLLQHIGRLYIGVMRGLPVLLLLMLTYYVAFARIDIHPVAVAVLAFGMNFAAYAAEIFRSGVRSIDPGPTEAGIAMGFSRMATFTHFILPQAAQRVLPVYRGEFISLIKMTSIVGYIGVMDLTKASDIIRSRTFEAFFPLVMVSLAYFLVIWLLGLLLDRIEKRSDPGWRRAQRQG